MWAAHVSAQICPLLLPYICPLARPVARVVVGTNVDKLYAENSSSRETPRHRFVHLVLYVPCAGFEEAALYRQLLCIPCLRQTTDSKQREARRRRRVARVWNVLLLFATQPLSYKRPNFARLRTLHDSERCTF